MLVRTYRIETARLVIRCYSPQDAPLLRQSINESLDHLLPWMNWAKAEPEPLAAKVERLRKYRGQFDLGEDYTFGIFSKDEKVLVGSTGLHPRIGPNAREVGYWINANYVGKGYATECVRALLKVGFEIEQLDRIEIRGEPANLASMRIPEKLGFAHEATLKNRLEGPDGLPRDVMIWSLFKDQYEASSLPDFELAAFDVCNEKIPL